mmetsp:Transcript_13256/g.33398  ORF Transcript_13256/g.33398 Transcript_13256/m.33398 type:complete len:83 (-) Transcript_13256:562-810(-)
MDPSTNLEVTTLEGDSLDHLFPAPQQTNQTHWRLKTAGDDPASDAKVEAWTKTVAKKTMTTWVVTTMKTTTAAMTCSRATAT